MKVTETENNFESEMSVSPLSLNLGSAALLFRVSNLSEPQLPHLPEGDRVSTETEGCFED